MGRFQGATSVWCAGDCLPGGLSWVGSRVVFRVFGWIGLFGWIWSSFGCLGGLSVGWTGLDVGCLGRLSAGCLAAGCLAGMSVRWIGPGVGY